MDMARLNLSIHKFMLSMRRGLTNSINEVAIMERLTPNGYGPDRMNEGLALCEKLEQAREKYERLAAAQEKATAERNKKKRELMRYFGAHIETCRKLFDTESTAYSALGLRGKRESKIEGITAQVKKFYNTALTDPEIQNVLMQVNLDTAKLQHGLDLLQELLDLETKQKAAMAEKEEARAEQVKQRRFNEKWFSTCKTVAKHAFTDRPHLMEILDVKVETE
jgi:DNA-binding protein H-NS